MQMIDRDFCEEDEENRISKAVARPAVVEVLVLVILFLQEEF